MTERYSALAQIYDRLMYDVSYETWADYLLGFLKEQGIGKGERILEYACGTGNITLPLAKAGYHVIALDAVEEMLFIAQEKTRKKAQQVEYVCGDMERFVLNRPARAAVCACDGVNYLPDKDALRRFFRCVHTNLQENGLFLFDISSAYKLENIIGNEFFYDDGEEETVFWKNHFDEQNRMVTMELTLFIAQGSLYERQDEEHIQRAWERAEIEEMLSETGFTDIRAYGFLEKQEPKEREERIQFQAIRKGTNQG